MGNHPPIHNLVIYQGDTFQKSLAFENSNGDRIDLSNWTLNAELRNKKGDLLKTFTVTITNTSEGTAEMSLTDTQTSDLSPGHHRYDLERTLNDGTVTTMMRGDAHVIEDVTA